MKKSIERLQKVDKEILMCEQTLNNLYTERREIINYLNLNKKGNSNDKESIRK